MNLNSTLQHAYFSPERVGLFSLCLLLLIYPLMSGVLINPYPLTVSLVALGFTVTLLCPRTQDLPLGTSETRGIQSGNEVADLFPED
jgi:tetrahydromethanopterin S-methyltransferase subunit E